MNQTDSGSRSEQHQGQGREPPKLRQIFSIVLKAAPGQGLGLSFSPPLPNTPHTEAQYTVEGGWMNG